MNESQVSQKESCRFALVLPALNEEKAIGQTLERAVSARQVILDKTSVDEVFIVFVNDGSTDATQETADGFDEVLKIRFKTNQGYGAAIKRGFLETDAQLVGFMDADGTCDPLFFVDLINHLEKTEADVVLGSRINPDSKMPFIRKLGNKIFARLIGWVSGQKLTDAASGMRVIQRNSLKKMMPLPDGLHFTPAMSAISVLDPRIKIEEIPMSYSERIGRSKLSVLKDGLRFISSIIFASLCYNPIRLSMALCFPALLAGGLLGLFLWREGNSPQTAAIISSLFFILVVLIVFSGLVAHQINFLLIGPRRIQGKAFNLLQRLSDGKKIILCGLSICLLGVFVGLFAIVFPYSYLVFWAITAGLVFISAWIISIGILFRIIWAVRQKQQAQKED